MPSLYPGLYNSSYVPEPLELKFAQNPGGYLNPYLVAVILSFLVAGVLCSQATSYWQSKLFREDPLGLKLHVALVLLLTVLKLLQIGAVAILDFSVHYGDYLFLTHKIWLFRISVLSATIVSATVQVFFIKRTFKFSRHSIVFLVPTLLAWLGSIGSAICVTIVFPENWADRSYSFVIAGRVAPGFTLACDLLVTGFAMYFLLAARTTFPDESPLSRIIRIMLESATPPCITALLNLVFDDQAAGGYVFLFVALTPLLQTFSMLYSLNSRIYFRERKAALTMQSSNGTPIFTHKSLPSSSSHGRTLSGLESSSTPPFHSPFNPEKFARMQDHYAQLPQAERDLSDPISPYPSSAPSPQSGGTPNTTRPLLLRNASPSPSPPAHRSATPSKMRNPMLPLRMQVGDGHLQEIPLEVPWTPHEDAFSDASSRHSRARVRPELPRGSPSTNHV